VAEYIDVIPQTQSLLPSPCPECLWWQTTHGDESGAMAREEWMRGLASSWGSTGMVLVRAEQTLAAVQFAPVRSLPRTRLLPAGPLPAEAVLVFCLRAQLGHPSSEASRLLHRAMASMRDRRVTELFAYARPLGSESLCGLRNLCGLEFLEAHGFRVVRGGGDAFLMRVDLRGLLPTLKEVGGLLRAVRGAAPRPSPAAWLRG
jgi:hypothetical protein